jgi:hypothetical protein
VFVTDYQIADAKLTSTSVPTVDDCLDWFRSGDYDDTDEDTKKKWLWFCLEFLPCVSKQWRDDMMGTPSMMKETVTTTDETWAVMALEAYGETWDQAHADIVESSKDSTTSLELLVSGVKRKKKCGRGAPKGVARKRFRSGGKSNNKRFLEIYKKIKALRASPSSCGWEEAVAEHIVSLKEPEITAGSSEGDAEDEMLVGDTDNLPVDLPDDFE